MLEWNYLLPLYFFVLVVWFGIFDRPLQEAFRSRKEIGRLADLLESSQPSVLLLRPFKEEKNLADATPAPGSIGTIEPSLTGFYKKLQRKIGSEMTVVGLQNDHASVGKDAIDTILVPNKLWQETVAIVLEGVNRIIVCLSPTGSGESLLWELDQLEANPEYCEKTVIFAQPHGWLEAYQKVNPAYQSSDPLNLLDGIVPGLRKPTIQWNQ